MARATSNSAAPSAAGAPQVGRAAAASASSGAPSSTQAEPTGIAARGRRPCTERRTRAARPITEIETDRCAHRPSGIGEFDRVLGGGIVPGAAILLSRRARASASRRCCSRSPRGRRHRPARALRRRAEESTARCGCAPSAPARCTTSSTSPPRPTSPRSSGRSTRSTRAAHRRLRADRVVVAVRRAGRAVRPGARGRIHAHPRRERARPAGAPRRPRHERRHRSPGPRILEHLVDVVCQFEGDRQTALRFVRALKNRFGPTDEVGCFEMTGDGIAEVADPAALFLGRARNRRERHLRHRSPSRAAARCRSRCRRSSSRRAHRSRAAS